LVRVAWRVFITARQFIRNPETGFLCLRRLTARVMPPGSSSSGTQKFCKTVCRLAALKARQEVSGKFPETQNYEFNRGKTCIFIQTQLQYITTN